MAGRLILAVLLLARSATAAAPTVASAALLVQRPDDSLLREALGSSDPAVRAVAARVITVTNRTALLPEVLVLLGTETNIETAREVIRAAIVLGGAGSIDASIRTSSRFSHRLDNTVAVATARLGTDVALAAYEQKFAALKVAPRSNFFVIALWGAPQALPPTAEKLLAANDEKGWSAFVLATAQSRLALDPANLRTALTHQSQSIRFDTIDALISEFTKKTVFSDAVKETLRTVDAPAAEMTGVAFKRELLRRIGGAEPRHLDAWVDWLRHQEVSDYFANRPAMIDLLTAEESAALRRSNKARAVTPTFPGREVLPPQFYTPGVLPDGASDAILDATGCRGEWIGLAGMSVDRAGRVVSLDLSGVRTDDNCRKALDAIARLALVHPTSIVSASDTEYALFVKPRKTPLCIDEGPVPPIEDLNFEGCDPFRFGGDTPCTPPVVRRRIEPKFPPGKSIPGEGSAVVVVEATITETGCIRGTRLVAQSPFGELNSSALLAFAGWTFKPATIDGKPIPVLFNLTINFRSR